VYSYGIELQIAGAIGYDLIIGNTTKAHFELEQCKLTLLVTSTASEIILGPSSLSTSFIKLKDCTLKFGNAGQRITMRGGMCEIAGGSIDAAGSSPSVLFVGENRVRLHATGFDMSHVTGTLVPNEASYFSQYIFEQCKLGSGVTVLAAQTSIPNRGSAEVRLYDCAAGDQHYHIGHYDAFGSTVVETSIYANDGAQYDGTNRCSWKIATTANCSYYTPYVSPWFGRYHSAASAITPSIEILRDGSATAYQDDEVWGEFSAKTTTGFTLATLYSDRMTLLGTPADQAAGVGVAGWTGENASAWSGKLAPASSFTPAEIGHLMARVCVGEPSITVYVDPAIRGA
jgi:hypothetical protein